MQANKEKTINLGWLSTRLKAAILMHSSIIVVILIIIDISSDLQQN